MTSLFILLTVSDVFAGLINGRGRYVGGVSIYILFTSMLLMDVDSRWSIMRLSMSSRGNATGGYRFYPIALSSNFL